MLSIRWKVMMGATALLLAASQPAPAAPSLAPPLLSPPQQSGQTALDIPIAAIAASPRGCAILDKHFPGLRAHRMFAIFKSMSLHEIAARSKGEITPAMLDEANTDLSAISFAAFAAPQPELTPEDPATLGKKTAEGARK